MGCVQSYFRKAHNAGLSPSSTQGSEKAALAADDVAADQQDVIDADDIERDIVIVDVDEITLAEKQDEAETLRVSSADANGSAKTGAIIAVAAGTGAVLGAAGAVLASAEELDKSPDAAATPASEENVEAASRASSSALTNKSTAEANDDSRPVSAANTEASEAPQPDDGSRPASAKEEEAPKEEEEVESAEPVPEVDSSRAESVAKSEDLGSRPTSASPSATEAAVDSRPESESKVDGVAESASVGSRAESAAQEPEPVEEGDRPTSASESVVASEPKDVPDSRASSAAISEKDEANAPKSTEIASVDQQGNPDIQIDDYSEPAPVSPADESGPESSVPLAVGPESDSSRPQSTAESMVQEAVNPETGTPQDRVSRSVSSTDSRPPSEQTSEQELTHEGSIVEPEESKDTSSKPPSPPESIAAEPLSIPSVSIDAEELGVEEVSQTAGDVKATDSASASESVQDLRNTEPTLEVEANENVNEQEDTTSTAGEDKAGSRPVSATPSVGAESNQTKESSRPVSAATLIVGQDDSNASRPDSSIEQELKESDEKPNESRPVSRVESSTGSVDTKAPSETVESRPESATSKAESGVASVSEMDAIKSPAETPCSDAEDQVSRPGSGVAAEGDQTPAVQTRPASSVSQVVAADSPQGSITTEDDLQPPPVEDEEAALNNAATTIQATFRGHQTRQALKNKDEGGANDTDGLPSTENIEATEPDTELDAAATKIQANFRGYKTRQEIQKQKDGSDAEVSDGVSDELPPPPIIPDSDAELESAATTIQANFRGYQTRQTLKKQTEGNETETGDVAEDLPAPPDVPGSDAELESAATTIQANFRGYQTRQALKKQVEGDDSESVEISAEDLPTPPNVSESAEELESAATTIQANFRGYQTRQALKMKTEGEDTETGEGDVGEDLPAPPDVPDPEAELESAATTIQANFRGYQTRQALKKQNDGEGTESVEVNVEDLPAPPDVPDSDAELESAATTIQANFRGYQTRQALKKEAEGEDAETSDVAKDLSADPGTPIPDAELESAATTIQANFRGYQTRQTLKKQAEGESAEAAAEDLPAAPESDLELESAATTIQANFRGYQTRKTLKMANEDAADPDASEVGATSLPVSETEPVPEILPGIEDEELVSAATTIQANFRGYQTRQALQKRTEGETGEVIAVVPDDETVAKDENDSKPNEEEVAAATTIQANFRGYQTRQALKKPNDGAADIDVAESVAGDLQTVDSLPGPESDVELASAATTIQANFRGYQTRQALKKGNEGPADVDVAESAVGDSQTTESLQGPEPDVELVENDLPITVETNAELESAATTIQANFRGYQTRQTLKKSTEGSNIEVDEVVAEDSTVVPESNAELASAATTIQANFRGYQTRQALKKTNEEDNQPESTVSESPIAEPVLAPENDADLNSAATTIQANFRGYQTRQELKKQTEGSKIDEEAVPSEGVEEPETDVELISAATTIQANYRGYQTRQTLKKQNEGGETKPNASSPEAEIPKEPESDIALDSAATTIQANFRGYQTRQALKKTDAKTVQNTETTPTASPGPDTMQILAEQSQAPPLLDLHNDLFGSPTAEAESSLTEVTTADASITDTTSEREGSLVSEPIGTTATPRSPETGEKVKDPSEDEEETLKELQKPQECDELPSQRGMSDDSSIDIDSSQSSAATKIQAGVRGFIARRQVQHMRNDTSTSTTAPSLPDSQQSFGFSISQDDEGVQAVGSPETEVQKQQNVTIDEEIKDDLLTATLLAEASSLLDLEVPEERGLSLDSKLDSMSEKTKSEVRSAISEQATPKIVEDEDQQVWQTLQKELEEAATTIQSNYRGYRTRQKLQREDAVQMPTTSSSTVSAESEVAATSIPHSGEFHDMIVLPPATPTIPETEDPSDQKP